MNLLLDTNVFIDFVGRRPPYFAAAERIVTAGYFGDVKLWLPVQSLNGAFYVLERYIDSLRIQEAFLHALEVITPVGLFAEDAVRAARLGWRDYEDCLIAMCADRAKADYVITRNKKDFERSSIPALTPEEWLSMMERSCGLSYDVVSLEPVETV